MSSAIPVHIALVDATGRIDQADLAAVAGALNEQVLADFAPVWHVRASVGAYTSVPPATWQIVIQAKLDEPGALGYHTDDVHNQPISYVALTRDWTATVSHECLEMLADAFGNRMHAARLPKGLEPAYEQFGLKHESSRVHYLVEVCDPCEATSYEVGGVPLSDFLLPTWYRTWPPAPGVAYSKVGGCTEPRQVASGGYVSFCNSEGNWYQCMNDGGLQVEDLGKFDRTKYATLREFSDSCARARRAR